MTERKYIGARYVPLFADPLQWDNVRTYEPLTIVLHDGNSYTSRQYVPAGIAITNADYWALSADYNAAIQNIDNILPTSFFEDNEMTVADALNTIAERLPLGEFDAENTVKAYVDAGLDSIAELLPANDFDSVNTVKAYVDAGLNDIIDSDMYLKVATPTKLHDAPVLTGGYFQGSHVDVENGVYYLAYITSGNMGYIVKMNLSTGAEIARSESMQIYHANSITMFNGKLYVTAYQGPTVLIVDPDDLTIESTFNVLSSPAWVSVDETNKLMVYGQGNQLPHVHVFSQIGADNSKYQNVLSFDVNLSGLEYNQGGCVANFEVYIPSWKFNENKSFISIYNILGNLSRVFTFADNFEIEDVTATSSTIYFTDSNGNLYSIPNTNYNGRYREPNTLSTNAKLHVYSLDRSIATYVNAGGHTDALQTKIPLANIYKQLAAKRTSNQSTIIGNLGICGLYSLDKTPMNNMSANIRRAFMFGPPTTNDYHIISLDLWYSYNGTDNSLNLYTPDSRATECLIDATTFEITNITVTKYDDWITNASNALFANGARIEIQDVYLEIGNDGNSSSGGATVTL